MKSLDNVKRASMGKLVDYLFADFSRNAPTVMATVNALVPAGLFASQRAAVTRSIEERGNWFQLLERVAALNPAVRNDFVKTFVIDGNLLAWGRQEKMREKHGCNIPWAILLDPTSACNLRCNGCWAAGYGHSLNLSYEDIDSIVRQGKELGVHIYIYTGGEPLVRLCEAHPDCTFLCFTNATLIDEAFCRDMLRVKNFVPVISSEGDEAATDSRRGRGTYARVEAAMDLLREHGLPFGVSCCFTSANAASIASEAYFDWLVGKGALFAWVFTYMPVGADAPTDLMPTPQQREHLYRFVREMRRTKPLFTLDFQNDGEFVGGCIAGGRRYLHINARGDVEPCVFVHYSNANIHEVSLLEALKSPIFMAYYRGRPFNDNLLRPCPMLENPECLVRMVEESGAWSTDLPHTEDVRDLCAKCEPAAQAWAPVAERIWHDPADPRAAARQRPDAGMAESDMAKLARQGRVRRVG